jgi:pimeloyl-ACP methyl ester carboxylesterase
MANETSNNEEITVQSNRNDKDGRPLNLTRLTPESDTRTMAILQAPLVVIPIIFLPGIMGTNLVDEDGKSVWNPPNLDGVGPVFRAIGQLVSYSGTNAARRQRDLNPLTTQVDYSGEVNAEGSISKELAKTRGWGALSRSSYQPMMSRLQKELNKIMELGKTQVPWDVEAMREPADYGEQKKQKALTQENLKHAANYRFDVWGGGYNWIKSNRDSSVELIEYIEKTVLASYIKVSEKAEKVILVTHSMGGLVARAICNIHNYSKVLGVVHGVMPATGAAATYHHARCGYEGIASVILGRDAAEVIAVMGNSPGALELIPTPDYNGRKPWLKLGGMDDEGAQLPIADPYEEIYKNRAWYGLIPTQSESFLDPGKMHLSSTSTNSGLSENEELSIVSGFYKKIDNVKQFHLDIFQKYPMPAYVHYGEDSGLHTWATVHWKGSELPDFAAAELTKDNKNGKISVGITSGSAQLEFGKAKQAGDGTVPATSGAAPGDAGVIAIFRQGDQGTGTYVNTNKNGKSKGYDHQGSYSDVRAQWATLYSIVKISKDANWHT